MKLKTYRATKEAAINADLKALFDRHGFKTQRLTASVDEASNTVRYTITVEDKVVKDDSGNEVAPEAARFTALAELYGMKPEWLGQKFRYGTDEFVVLGLRDTKAKNKVSLQRKRDGSVRIAPVQVVVDAFMLAELTAKAS